MVHCSNSRVSPHDFRIYQPWKWRNVPWKGTILKGKFNFQLWIFRGYASFQASNGSKSLISVTYPFSGTNRNQSPLLYPWFTVQRVQSPFSNLHKALFSIYLARLKAYLAKEWVMLRLGCLPKQKTHEWRTSKQTMRPLYFQKTRQSPILTQSKDHEIKAWLNSTVSY